MSLRMFRLNLFWTMERFFRINFIKKIKKIVNRNIFNY